MVERNYSNDLPIIIRNSELLLKFFDENFNRRFEYSDDDHYTFMILCFLFKQREHLSSVLSLINVASFSDAMIIARNMVEGVGIVLWVSENLQKRALQWRKYCVITDYRLSLEQAKRDKIKIDKNLLELSVKEGYEYLKERYKKPKIQIKNLPSDPFKSTWLFDDYGKEVKIYKFFGGDNKDLYDSYCEMSDWVHWNVSSIGTRLARNKSEVGFFSSPIKDGCFALSSAFVSMHYFYVVINQHLKLGLDDKIKTLSDNYLKELGIGN